MDITYCEGARLLQDSRVEIDKILVQRPNGGLTCKYCYLIITDSHGIEAQISSQDWPLVVSCHVQACTSLSDRRVAYSCYACSESGHRSIETSAADMNKHLQSCDLIKVLKLDGQRFRDGTMSKPSRPAPTTFRTPIADPIVETKPVRIPFREVEKGESSNIARSGSGNPFRPLQTVSPILPTKPATPAQQMTSSIPSSSPFASRSRTEDPLQAVKAHSTSNVRPPEQATTTNHSWMSTHDMFTLPGSFPSNEGLYPSSPQESLARGQEARRRAINIEAPGHPQTKGEPSRQGQPHAVPPMRAPPAPPVLSPGGPPPYSTQPGPPLPIQGIEARSSQPAPPPRTHPRVDTPGRADPAKVKELLSLGISALEAEYLLNHTQGDVNAAASLRFFGQGNVNGGPPMVPQPGRTGPPPASASSPVVDKRSRRSK